LRQRKASQDKRKEAWNQRGEGSADKRQPSPELKEAQTENGSLRQEKRKRPNALSIGHYIRWTQDKKWRPSQEITFFAAGAAMYQSRWDV